jgi:outer membrane protein assembly factor BamB
VLRLLLLVLGFLTTGVGACLDRRGLGVWTLERRLDLWIAGAVLLAALTGLLALAAARWLRVVGTVVGTLALVAVGVLLAVTIGTGLPGPWSAVVAVGSALLALVGVIGGFAGGRPRRARPAVVGTAAAGAVLLVVGLCGVVVPLVVDAPVRAWSAVVAAGPDVRPTPLPVVPARPSEVAWSWTAPGGTRDVRAAGTGVVVADDTGVTGLHGPSGTPRWGYHRAGAALSGLLVTPDRNTVVLRHASTGYGDDEAELLTVLDAGTGARRAEIPLADGARVLRVTDRVVVVPQDPPPDAGDALRLTYAAFDLVTGAPAWTWVSPPGCDTVGVYPTSTRTTVPVASRCDDRVVLTGLDEESGRERWRVDAGDGSGTAALALRSTSDGTAVVALGVRPAPVIDTTTGEVRTRLAAGDPVVDEGEPRLEVPDGATFREVRGDGTPLPPAPCARPTTLVAAAVIAVCRAEDGTTATVDGGPPLRLAEVRSDGFGLEPGSPGVRIVPVPGAVVVAGTSSDPAPVQGLS